MPGNLFVGASLAGCMLLFMLIGLLYTPYDPDAMSGGAKFAVTFAARIS